MLDLRVLGHKELSDSYTFLKVYLLFGASRMEMRREDGEHCFLILMGVKWGNVIGRERRGWVSGEGNGRQERGVGDRCGKG